MKIPKLTFDPNGAYDIQLIAENFLGRKNIAMTTVFTLDYEAPLIEID